MRRRSTDTGKDEGRKDKTPFVGSAVIHVGAFAFALWVSVSAPPSLLPESIAVNLYSPPGLAMEADDEASSQEGLIVERPDPALVPETPVLAESPTTVHETRERSSEPESRMPIRSADASSAVSDRASETEEPGEDLRVQMEGLEADFPLYYNNIIQQIDNCFRGDRSQARLARVRFVIREDGTVDDSTVEVVQASGDVIFDLWAVEAVECAGKGRFGPLPEEMGHDRLPVLFKLSDRGRVDA